MLSAASPLTVDAGAFQYFEGSLIWSPSKVQIVLALEQAKCSSRFRPHATVNHEVGTLGIECGLHVSNQLLARPWLARRRGTWWRGLRLRRTCSSGRRRWSSGGSLSPTRGTPGKRNDSRGSRNEATSTWPSGGSACAGLGVSSEVVRTYSRECDGRSDHGIPRCSMNARATNVWQFVGTRAVPSAGKSVSAPSGVIRECS